MLKSPTPEELRAMAEFKELMGENVMNLDATDFKNIKPVPTKKIEPNQR